MLEAVSKPQIRLKGKRHTLINTIRCVIPPTRGRKPIRRRLKSYGGTGEKAQSARVRWRMSILKRPATSSAEPFATQLWGFRWGFETISSNLSRVGSIFIFTHISFSSVTRVAHLKNTMTYLPPARYMPAKNTRCAITIKRGPPMIISRGLCQYIDKAPINPTAGKPRM